MSTIAGERAEQTRGWLAVTARGVLALVYFLFAVGFSWFPPAFLFEPAVVLGAYLLLDGLLALLVATTSHALHESRRVLISEGVLGVTAGLVALVMNAVVTPVLPFEAFYAILAGWAILTGLAECVAAIPLRREDAAEMLILLMIASGLARLVYGIVAAAVVPVLLEPLAGIAFGSLARTQSLMLFMYAIMYGGLQIGLGNASRRWRR